MPNQLTPDQLAQLDALLASFGVGAALPVNFRPLGPFSPIVNGVGPSPDPIAELPLFQVQEPAYPANLQDQANPLSQSARYFIEYVIDAIRDGNHLLINAISAKNGEYRGWNAVGRTKNPVADPAPQPMAHWTTFFSPFVVSLLNGDPTTVLVYDSSKPYDPVAWQASQGVAV